MRMLLVVASKHGSTKGIAQAISEVLTASGHDVETREASTVTTLANHDAAIIGSAVYMGRWMSEAREFYQEHQPELATMPVWLFSSGPLGGEGADHGLNAAELDDMMTTHKARDHAMFPGSLDPKTLGLGERLITKVVKAPTGDFRDWDTIRQWADGIARELHRGRVPVTSR